MGTFEPSQKKSSHTATILTTNLFRSRPFSKPSTEDAPTDIPDFQARLNFARSHAPDLNSLAANSSGDRASTIQPKLTVGAPNDQYEQEADRVADQVMSTPDSATQQPVQREMASEEEEVRTTPIASSCPQGVAPSITPLVQREAMPEEEEVQAKAIGHTLQREEMPEEELRTKPALQRSTDGSLEAGSSIESRLNSSKGGGSPLSDEVRSFMEPRFGADFSQVRVHTGSEAIQMNRDLNAQAFTHKQDVYFGAGKAPGKDALTAHELTHVVQQTGEVQAKQVSKQFPIQLKCSACEKDTEIQRALRTDPEANTPCKPFTDSLTAQFEWERLSRLVPIGSAIATGGCFEVKSVWDTYFAATSEPFPFFHPSSCVVQAAKSESTAAATADRAAETCLKAVLKNLPNTLQGVSPSSSDTAIPEIQLPLEDAIGPSAPIFVHRPDIKFERETNAAANIVGGGGTDGQGSDLFGDDDRVLGGMVIIQVKVIDPATGMMSGEVRWQPHILVLDTADFCPGEQGNFVIQNVTLSMSKLESMGLTRDVPITIDYDLDTKQTNFVNVKPLVIPSPTTPGFGTPPTTIPPISPPTQIESQFRSHRFAGQPTLEACGRTEHRMLIGEKDSEAVQKVQETLGEAGIPVQINGAYSEETKLAVAKFKREHSPQIIPSDGVVGPQTSHALDDVAVEHEQ